MLMPMLWTNNDTEMKEMNDFERNFWRNPFYTMNSMLSDWMNDSLETTYGMKTDVVEEDKDYKLQADLPGFNKEDIHMDLKDGVMTISAAHNENKDEKDEKTGKYLRRERSAVSYQRSFNVGEEVKPEEIEAKYENGVLTVTVPKKEAAIEQKEDVGRIEVK